MFYSCKLSIDRLPPSRTQTLRAGNLQLFCSSLVSNSAQHMVSTQEKFVELISGCAINAGEGVEKKEPSYTLGVNAN